MKRFIIGLILGFLIGTTVIVVAQNTGTPRPLEHILNDIWNPSTNSLTIVGV